MGVVDRQGDRPLGDHGVEHGGDRCSDIGGVRWRACWESLGQLRHEPGRDAQRVGRRGRKARSLGQPRPGQETQRAPRSVVVRRHWSRTQDQRALQGEPLDALCQQSGSTHPRRAGDQQRARAVGQGACQQIERLQMDLLTSDQDRCRLLVLGRHGPPPLAPNPLAQRDQGATWLLAGACLEPRGKFPERREGPGHIAHQRRSAQQQPGRRLVVRFGS